MDVWQRGTSFAVPSSSNAFYTADRWSIYRAATGLTVSRQATNDTTNLPNIQHAIRIQRDSGNTGTGGVSIIQHFETVNSIPFAGKQVTVSFYARKGANYSNAASAIEINLATGTGVDQNIWAGLTNRANPINTSRPITSAWTRLEATGTIATNATQLVLNIFVSSYVGTAGANDWIEITGVQLEEGAVATPFRRNAPSIQAELAACQRYYEKSYSVDVAPGTVGGSGSIYQGISSDAYANGTYTINFQVTKRVTPSLAVWSIGGVANVWTYHRSGVGDTNTGVTWTSWPGTRGGMAFIAAGAPHVTCTIWGHWAASAEL
jgi:hypothetical protein